MNSWNEMANLSAAAERVLDGTASEGDAKRVANAFLVVYGDALARYVANLAASGVIGNIDTLTGRGGLS